jgi:hypothetical protein
MKLKYRLKYVHDYAHCSNEQENVREKESNITLEGILKPAMVATYLLRMVIPTIKYSPAMVVSLILLELGSLLEEHLNALDVFNQKETKSVLLKIRKTAKRLSHYPHLVKTDLDMQSILWNLISSIQGVALLHGFGFSDRGGTGYGNSEIESCKIK